MMTHKICKAIVDELNSLVEDTVVRPENDTFSNENNGFNYRRFKLIDKGEITYLGTVVVKTENYSDRDLLEVTNIAWKTAKRIEKDIVDSLGYFDIYENKEDKQIEMFIKNDKRLSFIQENYALFFANEILCPPGYKTVIFYQRGDRN